MKREEAINMLYGIRADNLNLDNAYTKGKYDALDMAIKALEQEPKAKTGHWKVVSAGYGDTAYICECSECKDTVWVYKDADRKWNYCPNCGAKMEDEE